MSENIRNTETLRRPILRLRANSDVDDRLVAFQPLMDGFWILIRFVDVASRFVDMTDSRLEDIAGRFVDNDIDSPLEDIATRFIDTSGNPRPPVAI